MATTQRQLVRNHVLANLTSSGLQKIWGHLARSSVSKVMMRRALGYNSREWVLADLGLDMNSLRPLSKPLLLAGPNCICKIKRPDKILTSVFCILRVGIKRLSQVHEAT